MSDQLSEKYLLYLRDMSRKVVYGSGSSGNYSQVLIRGSKGKKAKQFQRITSLKLNNLIEHSSDGYEDRLIKKNRKWYFLWNWDTFRYLYKKGSNSALRLMQPQLFMVKCFWWWWRLEISDGLLIMILLLH